MSIAGLLATDNRMSDNTVTQHEPPVEKAAPGETYHGIKRRLSATSQAKPNTLSQSETPSQTLRNHVLAVGRPFRAPLILG